MLLTPFANAYLFSQNFLQPLVFTSEFVKIIHINEKRHEIKCLTKVIEYLNGTKFLHFSAMVENTSEPILKIRVNFTKSVTAEELIYYKSEFKKQEPSSNFLLQTLSSSGLKKATWDNLLFVIEGNSTLWIKYPHNDNYEDPRQYPLQFDVPWHIPQGIYGNNRLHTHMSNIDVYRWKTGQISDEELFEKYLITKDTHQSQLTPLGAAILGGTIAGITSAGTKILISSNWIGAVITILASIFASILSWFLGQIGVSKAQWIENVVEAEPHYGMGDGFFWSWGFHTTYVFGLIFEPPIGHIGSRRVAEELFKHHRIGIVLCETREFTRSWGSNRDASPEVYQIELWYEKWVNPGIFGTSSSDFWFLWE